MKLFAIGLAAGLINGLLGVGGGTLLIPALTHLEGIKQHKAHGTTITVILPTAITSIVIYALSHKMDISLTWRIALTGSLGSFIGARLMNHLNAPLLKKIFAVFIIITGIRLLAG